jgi:hypothetical protein
MKKIMLSFVFAFVSVFAMAQEEEKKESTNTSFLSVGLSLKGSTNPSIGVFVKSNESLFSDKIQKNGFNGYEFSYIQASPGSSSIIGDGSEVKLFFGKYFKKVATKGFYTGNSLSYTNIKFDEVFYEGKYRYFSFFDPTLGVDFIFFKKLRGDVYFNYQWNIEIKGKGDVDNQSFDNWIPNLGFRLSYDLY